jgi:hypothetical protein
MTHAEAVEAEHRLRQLLAAAALPPPDDIHVEDSRVEAVWVGQRVVVVIELSAVTPTPVAA